MSKFIKTSKGLKGFFKKFKPKFDPAKFKKLDPKVKGDLMDLGAATKLFGNSFMDQVKDLVTDENAFINLADIAFAAGYNWTENNLTPAQIASLVETADKGALQFANAPATASNKSRFVKISQEQQPAEQTEQENQQPQLPNFTIEEVVNKLVQAAQEAEAKNLSEKEIAMNMAKVIRSYNEKLAPFKSQLSAEGININDIAPRHR